MKRIVFVFAFVIGCLPMASARTSLLDALFSYVKNTYQFSRVCPQEKVYLHFDNTAYFQSDIIWFSAYVVDAATQKPAQSKILYVELLSPNGVVLNQLKLKVDNGQANGSLALVDLSTEEARALRGVTALPSGFYEVRAYTRTMLNFDHAGVFSRVFPVYETPEKEGDYSNPTMRRWSNPYDQQRPETDKVKKLNVYFFPEGGALVQGVPNRVAFKAMDENGMGVSLSGFLDTEKDEAPIVLKTIHDGMGSFEFMPSQKRYSAKFNYNGKDYSFRLPDVEQKGYALRLNNASSELINVQIHSQDKEDGLLGVTLMCKGVTCYFDTLSINRGFTSLDIPTKGLPSGVHQLTLFNAGGEVLSQRQLFVNNGLSVGNVSVSVSAAQYAPYEQVEMQVRTSAPDGTSFPATISVAVRDNKNLGTVYSDNVMTNMLLSSDLKGYIHNPEYYFESNDTVHTRALDLLMMVQGWTRYNWQQMARVEPFYIHHFVEDGLVVDGSLMRRMNDNPIEGATVKLKLYSPDRMHMQETSVVTDEHGIFGFSVEEFYGKWDMYLAASKDGKDLDCRMRLDRASRPNPRVYLPSDIYLPDFATIEDAVPLNGKTDEPALQANPDSIFLLENVDIYGRRKYVDYITFKAYDAEEDTELHLDQGKFTYMVRDYLKDKGYDVDYTRYDGVVPESISTREEALTWSLEQCPINNRRVLWYLHDEDSRWMKESYTPGFDIDMEDVKSIIVYDSPFDYMSIPIVRDVLSTEQIQELSHTKVLTDVTLGHGLYVIDISMYPKGLRRSKVKGHRQTSFRGYSEVPAFYAPEYPEGPIQGDSDFRRTLYWNPALTTDSTGNATLTFYNNGYSRQFDVSAEGITSDGLIMCIDN